MDAMGTDLRGSRSPGLDDSRVASWCQSPSARGNAGDHFSAGGAGGTGSDLPTSQRNHIDSVTGIECGVRWDP